MKLINLIPLAAIFLFASPFPGNARLDKACDTATDGNVAQTASKEKIDKLITCHQKVPNDEQYPLAIALTYMTQQDYKNAYKWSRIAYKVRQENTTEFPEGSNEWKGFVAFSVLLTSFQDAINDQSQQEKLHSSKYWLVMARSTTEAAGIVGCELFFIPGSPAFGPPDGQVDHASRMGICIELSKLNIFAKQMLKVYRSDQAIGMKNADLNECLQLSEITTQLSRVYQDEAINGPGLSGITFGNLKKTCENQEKSVG